MDDDPCWSAEPGARHDHSVVTWGETATRVPKDVSERPEKLAPGPRGRPTATPSASTEQTLDPTAGTRLVQQTAPVQTSSVDTSSLDAIRNGSHAVP